MSDLEKEVKEYFDNEIAKNDVCGFGYMHSKEKQDIAVVYLKSLGYNVTADYNQGKYYTLYTSKGMNISIETPGKIKGLIKKYFPDKKSDFEEELHIEFRHYCLEFEIYRNDGNVIATGMFNWSDKEKKYRFYMHANYNMNGYWYDRDFDSLNKFEEKLKWLYDNQSNVGYIKNV